MQSKNEKAKRSTNEKLKKIGRFSLGITLGVGFLLLQSGSLRAQASNPETFPSAEKAIHALFAAVKSNDEEAIVQVLGGGKDLSSSGDTLEDQHDRELFVKKYQEMHRLVEEPDGTTVLYIGAENWPFPVPLVSKNEKWYFDADAGSKEILFRRIGKNEANTIETCKGLASNANERAEGETNDRHATQPLPGYYFRRVKNGNAGTEGIIVLGYPAEYRSSGVMTFVIVPGGVVYEKDLGPKTATVAEAMTTWKADRSWHIVKQTE